MVFVNGNEGLPVEGNPDHEIEIPFYVIEGITSRFSQE
jgi:hypothetical protein